MADANGLVLGLALACASAGAMAQDSVAQNGMAQNGMAHDGVAAEASIAPPDNKKETDPDAIAQASRQEPRVRLGEGYACGDPATQIVPVADFRDAVHARLLDADTPGYRPLAVVERRSTADYPARLLQSNTPGAVGILLFVEPDGSVSKILSVCATDPAFVPFAEQVVAANRYRASTVAGKPVPDVAYQIVAYGVAED